MDKSNTFISKSAGLYNLLTLTEWASFKIMALGSAVMFGGMGFNYAQNNAPNWTIWIVLAAVILGYLSIDYGLSNLLKYYYDHKGDKGGSEEETKVRSILFRWTLYLIIFRFVASISMSLLSNTEVVNIATEDFNADYFINNVNAQDSLRNNTIFSLKTDYTTLSDNEADRIKEAKKEGHRRIQAARYSSKKEWGVKFKPHMVYAAKKIARNELSKAEPFYKWYMSCLKAKEDSTAIVQAEYEKTKTAENLYAATVQDTSTLSTKAKILAMGEMKAIEREKQVNSRYYFLTIAVSLFGILGWIGVYIRSLLRRAGVDYDRKRTFSHVLNQIINSWVEWALIKLEIYLKIDLDGDGTVGTVGAKKGRKGGFFKKLFSSTPSPTTAGTTAKTTHETTGTTDTTTAETTAITTHETTAETTGERVVVKPFHKRPTTAETTATKETVVPPTSVPTGVSPVVDKPRTTTTKEIVVQIQHGIGFVVHNGVKRDKHWVLKTLNAYKTRKKNYTAKGSDTTTVDANILLFTTYLEEIAKMESSDQ